MSNLVKWDPFQDMSGFFDEADKLFAHFLKSFSEELYAIQLRREQNEPPGSG